MSISTLVAIPEPRQPTINNAAPIIKDFLRPIPEDNLEAIIAPIAAPTIIELTTHSCRRLVSSHSLAINGKAPEITPWSRPNNKPAIPATTNTKILTNFTRLADVV